LTTDPDELLARLRESGGEPPLAPLRIEAPRSSARPGLAGRAVDAARGTLLRLLSPSLAEMLAQLERDRHRQRAELERLRARVEALERASRPDD
jgi:hypothetical protein